MSGSPRLRHRWHWGSREAGDAEGYPAPLLGDPGGAPLPCQRRGAVLRDSHDRLNLHARACGQVLDVRVDELELLFGGTGGRVASTTR